MSANSSINLTAQPSVSVTTNSSAGRRVPARSPGQSATVKQTSGLSIAYSALPMTTKSGWQEAADVLNVKQGRTGRSRLSAINAYVMVNSARRACQLPDLQIAPTDFSLPAEIPDVNVQATSTGTVFHITLNTVAYPTAVLVEGANGVPSGKQSTADSAYVPICVLTDGLIPVTDITPEYEAVWGPQEVGAQVAIRLTAINAAGMRGVPYEVVGIVYPVSAEAALPEPTETQLEAA